MALKFLRKWSWRGSYDRMQPTPSLRRAARRSLRIVPSLVCNGFLRKKSGTAPSAVAPRRSSIVVIVVARLEARIRLAPLVLIDDVFQRPAPQRPEAAHRPADRQDCIGMDARRQPE